MIARRLLAVAIDLLAAVAEAHAASARDTALALLGLVLFAAAVALIWRTPEPRNPTGFLPILRILRSPR